MAVCCQNLTLGALSSRSALSVMVGVLFKKFGPFLNTPLISNIVQQSLVVIFYYVVALLVCKLRTRVHAGRGIYPRTNFVSYYVGNSQFMWLSLYFSCECRLQFFCKS